MERALDAAELHDAAAEERLLWTAAPVGLDLDGDIGASLTDLGVGSARRARIEADGSAAGRRPSRAAEPGRQPRPHSPPGEAPI